MSLFITCNMVSWLWITTLDHCLRDNHQPGFGCQNVDTRPDKEAEPRVLSCFSAAYLQ